MGDEHGYQVIHRRSPRSSRWTAFEPTADSAIVTLVTFFSPMACCRFLKAAAKDGVDVRIAMTSSSAVRLFLPDGYLLDFIAQDCLSLENIHRPWKWRWVWRQLFTVDMVRYAIAKLALTVFAEELQRRLDADGVPILCASLDPGSVLSDDVLSIFIAPMRPLARRSMVSVDQGSFNALYVTTSPGTALEVRHASWGLL